MIKVFVNQVEKIAYKEEIEKIVHKALKVSKNKSAVVSVTFVDDEFIKDLNKKYRFKDSATDVLSFPLNEKNVLGDVFISVPSAQKNAKRFQHSLLAELKRLTIHGTLHLLGYKHKTLKEKEIMEKKEKQILGKDYW